jgi:hypothetical protein
MPGKPFYSQDEVCAKLGKTQDEVKALVRSGMLREFRDAGKVFFKADDIDKLAASAAGPAGPALQDTGEILLEPVADLGKEGDKGEPDLASLGDSSSGTSIIGLEPLPEEEEEKKEDTVITAKGVGVFDEDEVEADTDPMAKTQITTGDTDQVSLEGAGSGSGLLDLAREADDTALGADLLDEIYPGEEEGATATAEAREEAPAKPVEEAPAEKEPEEQEAAVEEPEDIEEVLVPTAAPGDTAEGMFSGLLVGALVLMAVAASVVAGVVQGYLPDYARFLGDGSRFYFFLGGAVLTPVIALVVGWFVGKALIPQRR